MTRWRVFLAVIFIACAAASLQGAELCSDVNNDGIAFSIADYVLLSRYVNGEVVLEEPINADVDLCGEVNIADLALYTAFINWGLPWQLCVAPPECRPATEVNWVQPDLNVVFELGVDDSIAVPIYFGNDQQLLGMTLGFHWSSSDVRISSVDVTGSVIPASYFVGLVDARDLDYLWADGDSNKVMITVTQDISEVGEFIEPQSGGLLAKLWVQVLPGTQSQNVDFDSAFVAPAGEFVFAPAVGGVITPTYIDPFDQIIISDICGDDNYTDCQPGDFNGDGIVNITDAVYSLAYIFQSGPAPRPWMVCSGDANGDCIAAITDAVYIIQYIFNGGPAPKSCLQFLDQGCHPGSYNPGPW